jgi:transposase
MKNQNKYTIEFKKEAIKLVTQNGYSQSEAGKSLGVSPKNISRWIMDFGDGQAIGSKNLKPEQEEINRLIKENKRLRLEREILKKAAAFFANERT